VKVGGGGQINSSSFFSPKKKSIFSMPQLMMMQFVLGMAWTALRKSINGLINKVNVANIKQIVLEIFNENLVRGRFVTSPAPQYRITAKLETF
jgi:hypothetical protein